MPVAPAFDGVMVERVIRCTQCSRPLRLDAQAYLLSINLRPRPAAQLLTDLPTRDFHDFFLGVPGQGVFCSPGCVHSWMAYQLARQPLVNLVEQETSQTEREG